MHVQLSMVKVYHNVRSLPGFTAQILFTYKHESSSSLRNYYSDLSALVTPADEQCVTDCIESRCAFMSPEERRRCITACETRCNGSPCRCLQWQRTCVHWNRTGCT